MKSIAAPPAADGQPHGAAWMRQWRTSILNISTSHPGIQLSRDSSGVFGVLVDWHLDGEVATMVSDVTGFAGLCTPTTYQILGGPAHESGRAAARAFVREAGRRHDEGVPTRDQAYPEAGRVRFHLLCPDAVRVIDAGADDLAKGSNKYSALWTASQRVLGEIRQVGSKAGGTQG